MKKTLFLALVALLLGFSSKAVAQNCEAIVLPHVGYSSSILDQMPQVKIDWYCLFSHNSFVELDQVPRDVQVLPLSAVIDDRTGVALDPNADINVQSLSVYSCNFLQLQSAAYPNRVYFATPGSAHPYLMLRTFSETSAITNDEFNTRRYDDNGNLIN